MMKVACHLSQSMQKSQNFVTGETNESGSAIRQRGGHRHLANQLIGGILKSAKCRPILHHTDQSAKRAGTKLDYSLPSFETQRTSAKAHPLLSEKDPIELTERRI